MIATNVIRILRKKILIAKHCFVLFCNRVGTTAFRSRDDENAWEKRILMHSKLEAVTHCHIYALPPADASKTADGSGTGIRLCRAHS